MAVSYGSDSPGSRVPAEYAQGMTAARLVHGRVESDAAPIRNRFIATETSQRKPVEVGKVEVPPLTAIMRSGRGNAVRLKLILSLLWAAVHEPFEVHDPASRWATVLGLNGPQGARQIRSALRWLADHRLIELTERPGKGSIVTLLDEGGTGTAYLRPNRRLARAERRQAGDYYVRLPAELWTQGWIQALGAPAIAMLLVFLHLRDSKGPDTEEPRDDLWISLSFARQRYHLTNETRYAGIKELTSCGLLVSEVQVFQTRVQNQTRPRHVHRLQLAALKHPPPSPGARQSDVDW